LAVQVDVMSHNGIGSDKFLGRAIKPLGEVLSNTLHRIVVPLISKDSGKVSRDYSNGVSNKTSQTTGFITLDIRTCRNQEKLHDYWYECLRERIQSASENLMYIRSRLRQLDKEINQEKKRHLNSIKSMRMKKTSAEKAKHQLAKIMHQKEKFVEQKNKLKLNIKSKINRDAIKITLKNGLHNAAEKGLKMKGNRSLATNPTLTIKNLSGYKRIITFFSQASKGKRRNLKFDANEPKSMTPTATRSMRLEQLRQVKQMHAVSAIDHVTEIKG